MGTALETVKIVMAREDNCSQMFCLVRNSDNPHTRVNAEYGNEADKETLISSEPSARKSKGPFIFYWVGGTVVFEGGHLKFSS